MPETKAAGIANESMSREGPPPPSLCPGVEYMPGPQPWCAMGFSSLKSLAYGEIRRPIDAAARSKCRWR
eukprot:7232776-Prymnesium_polylepis.1